MGLRDDVGGLLSGATSAPAVMGISLTDLGGIFAAGVLEQEDRPILIIVLNEGRPVWGHWFFPKPDDLTYTAPTRATVLQTLGGAYVDDFGEGVREITCNGRSSYKHGPLDLLGLGDLFGEISGNLGQGELFIKNLKDWVIRDFHRKREENARAGKDPDLYAMFFVDVLNWELWQVFPLHFMLRRHKQSPLLIQYSMRFVGLQRVI